MPFFLYGSFPNSRIKPRSATATANVYSISCPAAATTLVAAVNPNRTALTIENTSPGVTIEYGYSTPIVPGQGFNLLPGASADIVSLDPVYIYNPGPGAVDVDVDEGQG